MTSGKGCNKRPAEMSAAVAGRAPAKGASYKLGITIHLKLESKQGKCSTVRVKLEFTQNLAGSLPNS